MSSWIQEFSFALRHLRRHWRFSLLATLTLALGIGASTSIYSLVQAVVLQPLPFPNADRLVRLWEIHPELNEMPVSDPTFLDWRQRSKSFEHLAALRGDQRTLHGLADSTTSGDPEAVAMALVSPELFPTFEIEPLVGRVFGPEEVGDDSRLVVLSHHLWQRRFGGETTTVGRSIVLGSESYEVIGIMPETFKFPAWADAWIPLSLDPASDRDDHWLEVYGRLASGSSLEAARSEMEVMARQIEAAHPETMQDYSVAVRDLHDAVLGPAVRRGVMALFTAVGLLLLIACANVSNLLLIQATGRRRELSIRAALGAGRGRIVRMLQIESQVLAFVGGGLGFLLAWWAVPGLVRWTPIDVPRLDQVEIDLGVFAFAASCSIVSMALCSLLATLPALKGDPRDHLRDGGHGASGGGRRLRELLVAGEVALALVVVLGAGLMTKSFVKLNAVDPGFEPIGAVAVALPFPDGLTGEERGTYVARAIAQITKLPEVVSAGLTTTNPLRQFGFVNTVTPEDRVADAPFQGLKQVGWRCVTQGFFSTAGLPLLAGRLFDESDVEGTGRAMVLTRNLATELWPDVDPVGQRLFFGSLDGGEPFTVVGIVGDYRDIDLRQDGPLVFIPYNQIPMPFGTLMARVRGPEAAAAGAVRAQLRAFAPQLPIPVVESLATNLAAALARPRFNTLVLALFASLSLLLAALGIYGMMAYGVQQRRREIAVRMALGAAPRLVLRQFVGGGFRVAALGVGVGLVTFWATARFFRELLFETRVGDLASAGGAICVLLGVCLVASFLPALRATRVDPHAALGNE